MMASIQACAAEPNSAKNVKPASPTCEVDNPSLQAMPAIQIELIREDGSKHTMPAKLANTNATRAAGFQKVCASTIAEMPILFVFNIEQVPGFHMNNVVAPIDIAFIKKGGELESIQAMQPYSVMQLKKKLWRPKQPVKYALEVHPGFFEQHNINLKSRMRWEHAKQQAEAAVK